MAIELNPYHKIENQNFISEEIRITPEVFENITFINGKMVLSFENCNFKEISIFNDTDIDFKDISISFTYCLINRIKIREIKTEQINLHFHGCIIEGNIDNGTIRNVSLNNCIIPSLFLQNLNLVEISFTEENIFIRKWIALCRRTDFKNINDVLGFKQSIYINHVKKVFIRKNHNKTKRTGIKRDDYRRDMIKFSLSKEQKKQLNINVSIDFSKQTDELLTINDSILNSLSLTGTAEGKVTIENTRINNIYIHDYNSLNETFLYNISPYLKASKFEIRKSNMDNTWFDNIDFNSYKILSFYRTRFAKASFTSCNFPSDNLTFEKFKTLKNIHYPDQKPQNYFKDQYETFLQLRKSLENSGNYYEAQKLGAISKESLRKIAGLSYWDKFILWVSRYSNNHGLSIKGPFVCILIFSIIFYIIYLMSLGRIFISTNFDWNLVGYYFSFLDLTHKKDFLVPKTELNGWSVTMDFLNKVIVGFFIFQFISAFRKYYKK
ncbi:MAG: hypothetical protein H6607_09270 [Flavobacteriales bacterium]|nr:hypothetical protein [Flavobacteriales bacterium]